MRSFEGHANSRNRTRGVGNWGWPTAKRPTLANHYIFAGLLSILTLTRSNSFKIAFLVAKEWAATVFGDKKFQPKHVQTWDSMLITWNRLFVICSLLIVNSWIPEGAQWVGYALCSVFQDNPDAHSTIRVQILPGTHCTVTVYTLFN